MDIFGASHPRQRDRSYQSNKSHTVHFCSLVTHISISVKSFLPVLERRFFVISDTIFIAHPETKVRGQGSVIALAQEPCRVESSAGRLSHK